MKNRMVKMMVSALAVAVIAVSPVAAIDSYAFGFNADAPHDESGCDETSEEYINMMNWMNSLDSNSNDSGSSDSGSSDSSYTDDSSHVEIQQPTYVPEQPAYRDSSSSGSGSSGTVSSGSGSVATVAAPKTIQGSMTVNVAGGQKFRIVMNSARTSWQVLHCGISRASFAVADADGNDVAYSTIALAQGTDGLWYMDVSLAAGVDATGYTVAVTAGDASYLSTDLGVSGIRLNGVAALSTVPATDAK